MTLKRPYSKILEQLHSVGLRPTSQRMVLAKLLFDGTNRHVTAEMLHMEALNSQKQVSLATVYNTLNLFTRAGLLREIVIDSGCSYFDTNTTSHHHFYREDTQQLTDIDTEEIEFERLPTPPEGSKISQVDVVVRINEK